MIASWWEVERGVLIDRWGSSVRRGRGGPAEQNDRSEAERSEKRELGGGKEARGWDRSGRKGECFTRRRVGKWGRW